MSTSRSASCMAAKRRATKPGEKSGSLFTAEERAAMRERAKELKARQVKADGELEVRSKIAEMQQSDRVIAERLHALIKALAPTLSPKTWYGMPAYAEDDRIICFFQPAEKFKTRYATLGFSDEAKLDEGPMWPTAFALMGWTPTEEARIAALVKRAMT